MCVSFFADNFIIWTTDKYPVLAKAKLNRARLAISTYSEMWELKSNTNKKVYTIFSRCHKVANRILNIRLNGKILTKDDFPVYIGVKLDSQMKLDVHIKNLREKAKHTFKSRKTTC